MALATLTHFLKGQTMTHMSLYEIVKQLDASLDLRNYIGKTCNVDFETAIERFVDEWHSEKDLEVIIDYASGTGSKVIRMKSVELHSSEYRPNMPWVCNCVQKASTSLIECLEEIWLAERSYAVAMTPLVTSAFKWDSYSFEGYCEHCTVIPVPLGDKHCEACIEDIIETLANVYGENLCVEKGLY